MAVAHISGLDTRYPYATTHECPSNSMIWSLAARLSELRTVPRLSQLVVTVDVCDHECVTSSSVLNRIDLPCHEEGVLALYHGFPSWMTCFMVPLQSVNQPKRTKVLERVDLVLCMMETCSCSSCWHWNLTTRFCFGDEARQSLSKAHTSQPSLKSSLPSIKI